LFKKDPDLVKYMDQRDITTRQYNAAVGQGLQQEAADYKARLDMLDGMIKARQTQIGDDQFYADAINQIQAIIVATQKSLDDDKKRAVAVLDQMQQNFARTAPAQLAPQQAQLAAAMQQKLADVTA